jgi:hypothetical protein
MSAIFKAASSEEIVVRTEPDLLAMARWLKCILLRNVIDYGSWENRKSA